MIFEFKTSFDDCKKMDALLALKEVENSFIRGDYLPNKWNSTNRKNKDGYSVAQFRITDTGK